MNTLSEIDKVCLGLLALHGLPPNPSKHPVEVTVSFDLWNRLLYAISKKHGMKAMYNFDDKENKMHRHQFKYMNIIWQYKP